MSNLRVLFLAVLVSSCAVAVSGLGEFSIAYRRLEVADVPQPGPWRVASILSLTSPDPNFGGLSDLAMRPDGSLLAISDNGHWYGFRPGFDADGSLARIAEPWGQPMRNGEAGLLTGKQDADAEGLAALPEGGLAVSFERRHRLVHYAEPGAASRLLDVPNLRGLPENQGIEALAVLPDGGFLLLAEGGEKQDGLPAFLGKPGGDWQRLAYPFDGEFRPTGLTVGPGGAPYALERAFSFPAGPRGRIMRLTIADATIKAEPVALLQSPIPVDNAEGIVWLPDPAPLGSFLIISDDNFSPLQKTLIWQLLPYHS